jgi:hypothetical protein
MTNLTADNFAGILTAAATVLGALALLIIAIRGFRRLEAKVGSVHLVAEQVNKSVNHVGDGEQTLRETVCQIHTTLTDYIVRSNERFDKIEEHLTKPTVQIPVVQPAKATRPRKASQ